MKNCNNWLMILDKCHYQLVKTIKRYDYSNTLLNLQNQLKSIINNSVNNINPMEYNGSHKKLMYILVSFCDNLFIIYGPKEFHSLWHQESMEKNYFNTVTSGYIFYKDILKIIETNENISEVLIYGYFLFFESLGPNNEFYPIIIKKFFQENIKNFSTEIPVEIKNYNYFHHGFLKTNMINIIFLSIFFIIIILGNRYVYWQWVLKNI
jgi:hypothetical protein